MDDENDAGMLYRDEAGSYGRTRAASYARRGCVVGRDEGGCHDRLWAAMLHEALKEVAAGMWTAEDRRRIAAIKAARKG